MKKKVKVVMLPTEKAENSILKHRNGKLQYFGNKYFTQDYLIETERKSFHIYLVSDEYINNNESSKGGWGYNIKTKEIIYCDENFYNPWVYKIIATTDKSLKLKEHINGCMEDRCLTHTCNGKCLLPQIPQSFIEAYVKANGEIDEVEVEYEQKRWGNYSKNMNSESINHTVKDYLIVTESNKVIISLKEEDKLYTEKEVESKLQKFRLYSLKFGLDANVSNKWIKENL